MYCRSRTPCAPYGLVNFSAVVGTFLRWMSSAENEPLPIYPGVLQRTTTRIFAVPEGTVADPSDPNHTSRTLFESIGGYAVAVEIRPFVAL